MAYTATYSASDLDNIFIDIVGLFGAAFAENTFLIVTLLIIGLVVALVFTGVIGGLMKGFGNFAKRF